MRSAPENSGVFALPRADYPALRVRTQTVDLEGPVHYADYGGDGPPLLMVHGLGGSHLNWAAVAPAFARRHRVVALDLAGHGRTPLGKRGATLEANTELIARFHAALFNEPATLMGNSMGGLLAQMVAARHAGQVRALVLVNASQPLVRGAALDREVALAFAALMLPGVGLASLRFRDVLFSSEALVKGGLRLCCADPETIDRALVEAHIALFDEQRAMPWRHHAFLAAARSTVRAVLTPRYIARIAERVKAPTLVIHGARDRLVTLAAARAAASRRGWDLAEREHRPRAPNRVPRAVRRDHRDLARPFLQPAAGRSRRGDVASLRAKRTKFAPSLISLAGSQTQKISAEEHALVLEALALAKTLCLVMEADKHRDDEHLVEVRLLLLIERVVALLV